MSTKDQQKESEQGQSNSISANNRRSLLSTRVHLNPTDWPIQIKLIAVFLLLSLLPMGLVELFVYKKAARILLNSQIEVAHNIFSKRGDDIRKFVDGCALDVSLMSKNPAIQGIVRARDNNGIDIFRIQTTYEEWVNRLNTVLDAIAAEKKFYHQLRYINEAGEEMVRVDWQNGRTEVISDPAQLLTHQAFDPCFLATRRLQAGEIYVSPLTLLRDRGNIVQPHTPVMLFSTPIFDILGNFRGIVVATVYASAFLEELQKWEGKVFLANSDGYYLMHPDPSKTFAFEFSKSFGMKTEFQELNNFFQLPMTATNMISDERDELLTLQKIHFDSRHPERYWVLLNALPKQVVLAPVRSQAWFSFYITVLVVFIVIALAFLFSKLLTRQIAHITSIFPAIAGGNFTSRVQVSSQDELGKMAIGLNALLDHLCQTIEKEKAAYEEIAKLIEAEKESNRRLQEEIAVRHKAETALQETYNWLKAILESTDDPIFAVNRDFQVIAFNSPFPQVVRKLFKTEVKVGSNVLEIYSKQEYRTEALRNYHRVFSGDSFLVEASYGDDVFHRTYLELDYNPIFGNDQMVVACTVFVRDITARKRAEEQVVIFRRFVEASGQGFGMASLEGKVIYLNPAMSKLMEAGKPELLYERPFSTFWPEDQQSLLETEAMPAVSKEHHWMGETEVVTATGKRVPVIQNLFLIQNDEKQPLCIASVTTDITDRKQTELAQKEARETAEEARLAAERSNRAKTDFLANVSHELRTPLNAVLGFSQILLRDRSLDEKQRDRIQSIQRSADHLLTLINDILDISRIETGHMEISNREFDFRDFLKGLITHFRLVADQKGITFHYEVQSSLPCVVDSDQKRLRQIMINLLGNAFKFTDSGGVTFRVSRRLERIYFEVQDTGIGIAKNQCERIFEPFHQVSSDKSRTAEGTGLGLAITKNLVEIMGGRMGVESTLGKGSIFWVDLGLKELEGVQSKNNDIEHDHILVGYQGRRRNILLIDDIPENRLVLSNLLSPLGFNLQEATNGKEGLEKVEKSHPDLILMDLVMPVMDGFECTRRIRRDPDLKEIKVIATSAIDFDHSKHAKDNDFPFYDDFLGKPVQTKQLFKILQSQLQIEWCYEGEDSLLKEEQSQDADVSSEENAAQELEVAELSGLTPPPKEEVEALLAIAKRGDIRQIGKEVAKLAQENPDLKAFENRVNQLVKGFKMKQIRDMLRSFYPEELS